MDPIIQILLSAGGATVLAALINAVMNKRKLSAEATEIITKAAAGTVENVVKDNTTLRARVDKLESQVGELQRERELHEQLQRAWTAHEERYRWHLERWHRYSTALRDLLASKGIYVAEEMPPIYPDLRL